ncbi:MAG TPA: hypothetical protein GX702_01245, partial [Chloroflexi bacterium]|nr:hypothetical protein [Chloroflexota bacterium]
VRADAPDQGEPVGSLPAGGPGTLMLDGPVDELPVVADRGWNRVATSGAPPAIVLWWLILWIIGLMAWPLVARLMPRFRDGGYALSRGIGLLLVGYTAWIGASLRVVPYTVWAAWGALLLVGVASFFR